MPVLMKAKHEQFAQNIAKGLSLSEAYISAGYARAGAAQSGLRLLKNAHVCARVKELQETLAAGTIALEISNRNARVRALQDRWDKMRKVIEERAEAKEFSEIAGGKTGLLCRDLKGKDATQEVFKVDTGLLAELRQHEKQAAQELGQWSEEKESQGPADLRFRGTFEELLVLYRETLMNSPETSQ